MALAKGQLLAKMMIWDVALARPPFLSREVDRSPGPVLRPGLMRSDTLRLKPQGELINQAGCRRPGDAKPESMPPFLIGVKLDRPSNAQPVGDDRKPVGGEERIVEGDCVKKRRRVSGYSNRVLGTIDVTQKVGRLRRTGRRG